MSTKMKEQELVGLIVVTFSSLILAVLSTWYIWNNQTDADPLPDILLDNIYDMSHVQFGIVNILVTLQYIIGIYSFKREDRFKYIAQTLLLQSIISVLRAITATSTLLPNLHVYDYCKLRPDNFFQVLGYMIQYGTCADYMFSGHTATSTLSWLMSDTSYKTINFILLTQVALFLLLQRWHYTVDIIVGFVVAWGLHYVYVNKGFKEWYYFNSFVLKEKRKKRPFV